ncbi:hypothetical protein [Oceanimonas smirnovii]|uniref:hypothetical protein n=1 Tax=Oceanimonas smirnovii TaxID=264574 RepID=UPI000372F23A|nr:hypothetical protein [Oceanimonas smirnovii]
MDLSLLPPFCYLSGAFHSLLAGIKKVFLSYPRSALTVLGLSYLLGLLAANIPSLGWPSGTAFLIGFAPVFLPLAAIFLYLCISITLLALFAANHATRLLFAAGLLQIVILPDLILSLDDTRPLMALGQHGSFILILLQMALVSFIGWNYRHWLIRHGVWCAPVLIALTLLSEFEGHYGFAVSDIEIRYSDIKQCDFISGQASGYDRHYSYRRCEVALYTPARTYRFSNLPVPYADTMTLQIRHGIFDHYQLLPAP